VTACPRLGNGPRPAGVGHAGRVGSPGRPVLRWRGRLLRRGFRGAAVRAVPYTKAEGDITDSAAIAWKYDQDTPYVLSPVLYDGLIYFTKRNTPALTCLDARTGKAVYGPERLEGIREIYATSVAAASRFTGASKTTVLPK